MDLAARIEAELRERLAEAVDVVCLQTLVERRRARGLPPLESGSPYDRAEYETSVRAFLAHLESAIGRDLAQEQAGRVQAAGRGAPDETARLVAVQLALARELPDYWQRFDASRASFDVEPALRSGSERRGLLDRLLGRG